MIVPVKPLVTAVLMSCAERVTGVAAATPVSSILAAVVRIDSRSSRKLTDPLVTAEMVMLFAGLRVVTFM